MVMRHYARNPLPGDPADPGSLRALLERYLLWMATQVARAPSWSAASRWPTFLRWCHPADRHSGRRGDA